MQFITEDHIKQVGLKFLKSYYKNRPRSSTTQVAYDKVSARGAVVDALLSFDEPDGGTFLASLEATSYHTKEEVTYKPKIARLFWDSLALSCLGILSGFSVLYIRRAFELQLDEILYAVILTATTIVCLTFIFRFLLKFFPLYRQIYAVEQFRLYEADEKWIAIGEDVFENAQDKYLLELRKQVSINGCGLLLILHDDATHLVTAPARNDYLKKAAKRKNWYYRFYDLPIIKKINTFLLGIKKRFPRIASSTMTWENSARFRRFYWLQSLIIMGSIFSFAIIFLREYEEHREHYLDTNKYYDEVRAKLEPEPLFFVIDSPYVVPLKYLQHDTLYEYQRLVTQQRLDSLKDANFAVVLLYDDEDILNYHKKRAAMYEYINSTGVPIAELDLSKENKEAKLPTNPTDSPSTAKKPTPSIDIKPTPSICDRYQSWRGKWYIIRDGLYDDRTLAEARIEQLAEAGFTAKWIWMSCFKEQTGRYAVYIEDVYSSPTVALEKRNYFDVAIKYKGVSSGDLLLIPLEAK